VTAALTITSLTAWSWATSAASPTTHTRTEPEEDQPGWACLDDGNQLCHPIQRTIPIRVTGHFRTGFTVLWSDGHQTSDPAWVDVIAECQHDEAPDVCVTAWSGQYRMYGIARAMLRGAR
jgi:hypothetical protein